MNAVWLHKVLLLCVCVCLFVCVCVCVCEWDSRAIAHVRKLISRGKMCQKSTAEIFLPPLHIKLGLMKNFVKAMKNLVKVLSV